MIDTSQFEQNCAQKFASGMYLGVVMVKVVIGGIILFVAVGAGGVGAQSELESGDVGQLIAGEVDAVSFDYGAAYFRDGGEGDWARLRNHLEEINADADPTAPDDAKSPRLCRSHAIYTGMQGAELAPTPDDYARNRSALLDWAERVRGEIATQLGAINSDTLNGPAGGLVQGAMHDRVWRMQLGGLMGGGSDLDDGTRMMALQYTLARGCESDVSNQVALTDYVENHGWPRLSIEGETVARAAWLILQHAAAAEQDARYPEIQSLYEAGEVRPQDFALLHDRVMLARGEPQAYGSQYVCAPSGRYELHELTDPERVDERRAAMGLNTVAENGQRFARLTCEYHE